MLWFIQPTLPSVSVDSVVGSTERERGCASEREREAIVILTPMPAGTSLKSAGGESFEAAVKEISDKSLNLGEGTYNFIKLFFLFILEAISTCLEPGSPSPHAKLTTEKWRGRAWFEDTQVQ